MRDFQDLAAVAVEDHFRCLRQMVPETLGRQGQTGGKNPDSASVTNASKTTVYAPGAVMILRGTYPVEKEGLDPTCVQCRERKRKRERGLMRGEGIRLDANLWVLSNSSGGKSMVRHMVRRLLGRIETLPPWHSVFRCYGVNRGYGTVYCVIGDLDQRPRDFVAGTRGKTQVKALV